MKKAVTSIEEIKRKLERYCVYQDRSHKEIEKKLAEYNLIEEAKGVIILHLLEHDFLNEERFAKSFARGKFRIKKWGKQRITRELKARDISAYNIKTALKEIEEADYLESLVDLISKKNKEVKEENIFKRKKKIYDFLAYRGYESDLIFKYMNEIIN